MNPQLRNTFLFVFGILLIKCGSSSTPYNPYTPTSPSPPIATTPTTTFTIDTLTTVYRNAGSHAEFTEGSTANETVGKKLLGVDSLEIGTTVLNNELLRNELQQVINRVNEDFSENDYLEGFGETKQNLKRYFNDADNDGWSVDGRHGAGRDWPHDSDGNDPDGWTSQIIITVSRP